MSKKLSLLLRQAFFDAISDREQASLDNEHNAPNHAKVLKQCAKEWRHLQGELFPSEQSIIKRAVLLRLDESKRTAVCEVLHFAIIAKQSVVNAHHSTPAAVRTEQRDVLQYRGLLNLLSLTLTPDLPLRNGVSLDTLLGHTDHAGTWEDAGDGGRVFRPRLPE